MRLGKFPYSSTYILWHGHCERVGQMRDFISFRRSYKGEIFAMKKYITTFLMMAMMAVMIPLASATSASAQTRRYYTRNGRTYYTTTTTVTTRRPSFYRRHRNIMNIAIGTGAGMLLGGLIGGRRGAGIGALAGAGGSALYTYKIRPKRTRYYYYR